MTFWTLSMSDLEVPTVAYERQIAQVKAQLSNVEDNRDMVGSISFMFVSFTTFQGKASYCVVDLHLNDTSDNIFRQDIFKPVTSVKVQGNSVHCNYTAFIVTQNRIGSVCTVGCICSKMTKHPQWTCRVCGPIIAN